MTDRSDSSFRCFHPLLPAEVDFLNCAEGSPLDVSLEEGMDAMDMEELHREHSKRARAVHPSISDLRLAVDAAAEMQVARTHHWPFINHSWAFLCCSELMLVCSRNTIF